jgi:uncharacterized protein (DUF2384 family)
MNASEARRLRGGSTLVERITAGDPVRAARIARLVAAADAERIAAAQNTGTLSDLVPILTRLEDAFGTNQVGQLLGVRADTISNWKRRRVISPKYANRVIDLDDVLVRALRVFQPQVAMDWLVGSEPFLNGARPIDVLVSRGAAPLLEALAAIEAMGYA